MASDASKPHFSADRIAANIANSLDTAPQNFWSRSQPAQRPGGGAPVLSFNPQTQKLLTAQNRRDLTASRPPQQLLGQQAASASTSVKSGPPIRPQLTQPKHQIEPARSSTSGPVKAHQTLKRNRPTEEPARLDSPVQLNEARSRPATPSQSPTAAAAPGPAAQTLRSVQDTEKEPKRRRLSDKNGSFEHHVEPVYRWIRGETPHPATQWSQGGDIVKQMQEREHWMRDLEAALQTAVRENKALQETVRARDQELAQAQQNAQRYLETAEEVRKVKQHFEEELSVLTRSQMTLDASIDGLRNDDGIFHHDILRQEINGITEATENLWNLAGAPVADDLRKEAENLRALVNRELSMRDRELVQKDAEILKSAAQCQALEADLDEMEVQRNSLVVKLAEMVVIHCKMDKLGRVQRFEAAKEIREAGTALAEVEIELDLCREELVVSKSRERELTMHLDVAFLELGELRGLRKQYVEAMEQYSDLLQSKGALEEKLAAAATAQAELHDERRAAFASNDELVAQLAEAYFDVQAFQTNAERSLAELKDIKTEFNALTRLHAALNEQNESLRHQHSTLQDAADKESAENARLQESLRKLRDMEISGAYVPRAEHDTLLSTLSDAQLALETLSTLEEKLRTSSSKCLALSQEVESLTNENGILRKAKTQLKEELRQSSERERSIGAALDASRNDAKKSDNERQLAETARSSTQAALEALTLRFETLSLELAEAKAQLAEERGHVSELERSLSAERAVGANMKDQVEKMEVRLAAVYKDCCAAVAQVADRDATVRALREFQTQMQEHQKHSNSRADGAELKVAVIQNELDELRRVHHETQQLCEQLQGTEEDRQSMSKSFQVEKEGFQKEIESLNSQIAELAKTSGPEWERRIRNETKSMSESLHRSDIAKKDNEIKRRDAKINDLSKRLQASTEELNKSKARPTIAQPITSPATPIGGPPQGLESAGIAHPAHGLVQVAFGQNLSRLDARGSQESEEIESVAGGTGEDIRSLQFRARFAVANAVKNEEDDLSSPPPPDNDPAPTQPTEETLTRPRRSITARRGRDIPRESTHSSTTKKTYGRKR